MVDCEAIENQRQNEEDRKEGLEQYKSGTESLVKGGTHAEELWRAEFVKGFDAETVHPLGGGICYFDARSSSEHEDDHGGCDPCSEGEGGLIVWISVCGW